MGIHPFSLQVSHISSAHMETFSVQLLPEYTPSKPAPDYSSKLLPGEKCIQRSPRLIQRGDNASFTYRQRGMTLKLMDCREEDRHPSYGLGSTIRGEVALDNRRRVVAVAAKVCGICRVRCSTTSFLISPISLKVVFTFQGNHPRGLLSFQKSGPYGRALLWMDKLVPASCHYQCLFQLLIESVARIVLSVCRHPLSYRDRNAWP